MIRATVAGGLVVLLALVLYLPAAYSPESFLQQLHAEHERNARLLGPRQALRIVDRMSALQRQSQAASPIPGTFSAGPSPNRIDVTVARQVTEASARLLDSQYVQSVDALFILSLYRLSSLLEWLPLLCAILAAALIDGAIRRTVKSKEFVQHDPEFFAIYGVLTVLTGCGLAIALVLPVDVHPLALLAAPLLAGLFLSGTIANFHARG